MKGTRKLNEKQIESIRRFMLERLGWFVREFEINHDEKENEFTVEIPKEGLGIFRHAMSKVVLVAHYHADPIPEDAIDKAVKVSLNLRYDHVTGGSNGCKLDIRFQVWNDGRTIEVYE